MKLRRYFVAAIAVGVPLSSSLGQNPARPWSPWKSTDISGVSFRLKCNGPNNYTPDPEDYHWFFEFRHDQPKIFVAKATIYRYGDSYHLPSQEGRWDRNGAVLGEKILYVPCDFWDNVRIAFSYRWEEAGKTEIRVGGTGQSNPVAPQPEAERQRQAAARLEAERRRLQQEREAEQRLAEQQRQIQAQREAAERKDAEARERLADAERLAAEQRSIESERERQAALDRQRALELAQQQAAEEARRRVEARRREEARMATELNAKTAKRQAIVDGVDVLGDALINRILAGQARAEAERRAQIPTPAQASAAAARLDTIAHLRDEAWRDPLFYRDFRRENNASLTEDDPMYVGTFTRLKDIARTLRHDDPHPETLVGDMKDADEEGRRELAILQRFARWKANRSKEVLAPPEAGPSPQLKSDSGGDAVPASAVNTRLANLRIAITDTRLLGREVPGHERAEVEFATYVDQRRKLLRILEDSLTEMIAAFHRAEPLLDEVSRGERRVAIRIKAQEFQAKSRRMSVEVEQKQRETFGSVVKLINATINEIRRDLGYDAVLDHNGGPLSAAPELAAAALAGELKASSHSPDITNQVIQRMRSKHGSNTR